MGGTDVTINDSTNAPAIGTLSNTSVSVAQILTVTNANYDPAQRMFFDGDSTGGSLLNNVLNLVNATGNVALIAAESTGTTALANSAALLNSFSDLQTGVVYVNVFALDEGTRGQSELAAIDAGIGHLNNGLNQFGITLVDITGDANAADIAQITVQVAATSEIGGAAEGVLGVTSFGGQITMISGWDYYLGSDPTAVGAGQYDFQTVVTHELGHALSLGHSADTSSVMYPYLAMGAARHDLSAADLSVIEHAEEGTPEPLLASGFSAPGVRTVSQPTSPSTGSGTAIASAIQKTKRMLRPAVYRAQTPVFGVRPISAARSDAGVASSRVAGLFSSTPVFGIADAKRTVWDV